MGEGMLRLLAGELRGNFRKRADALGTLPDLRVFSDLQPLCDMRAFSLDCPNVLELQDSSVQAQE